MNIEAEDDALFWIAKEATGSMRDAYTLFDQVAAFSDGVITIEKIREKLGLVGLDSINAIVEAMAEGDSGRVISLSSDIIAGGVSIEQFAEDLAEYFRSLLFISCGIDKESLLGYASGRYSEKAVEDFTKPQLEKALELVFNFYRDIRYSINERFEFELVLSRLSDLASWISPVEIRKRLEALKQDVIGSAGGRAAVSSAAAQRPPVQRQAAPQEQEEPRVELAASAPSQAQPEPQQPEAYHAQAADPTAAQTAAAGFSQQQREEILEVIRKKKLTLASAIEKAASWKAEGEKLIMSFDNGYTAQVVRNDRQIVKDAISEQTGRSMSIEVEVIQAGKAAAEREDDGSLEKQAAAVQKIFRGEIVQGGE